MLVFKKTLLLLLLFFKNRCKPDWPQTHSPPDCRCYKHMPPHLERLVLHMHTHMQTHICAHMYTYAHAHTYKHTYMHTHTHRHRHIYTLHTCVYAYIHAHLSRDAYIHIPYVCDVFVPQGACGQQRMTHGDHFCSFTIRVLGLNSAPQASKCPSTLSHDNQSDLILKMSFRLTANLGEGAKISHIAPALTL